MTERIRWWLKGYVEIRVKGFGAERFFNLLKGAGVEYRELRQRGDGFYVFLRVGDFYRIRPYLRKAGVSMRIVSRAGLPFVLYRNRKRKALAGAVLSFFVFLYGMSLFVWNISFEGNWHYSRETLLDYLASQGVECGMMKHRVSCEELEEGLRSSFPEITWVSARVSGTRLLVKIKENEVLSAVPEAENEPCEVVAERAGVVVRMVVRQGKAAVAVGDQVEEGQQLIGGQLSIMNDAGEVVRNAWVHGDGEIYARTRYEYSAKFPQFRRVTVKTGRKRRGFGVTVGPFRFRFLMPDFGKREWNDTVQMTQLCLLGDFYLPVFLEQIAGEEFVAYERPYTREEKEEAARACEESYLKNLMEKGVQIIENNVKIQEDGVSWNALGTVIAEEEIGVKRYITEFEETEETDERN